ncbi:hypothetical protein ACFL3V_02315, partial [Nanoarchaeota archaeon]
QRQDHKDELFYRSYEILEYRMRFYVDSMNRCIEGKQEMIKVLTFMPRWLISFNDQGRPEELAKIENEMEREYRSIKGRLEHIIDAVWKYPVHLDICSYYDANEIFSATHKHRIEISSPQFSPIFNRDNCDLERATRNFYLATYLMRSALLSQVEDYSTNFHLYPIYITRQVLQGQSEAEGDCGLAFVPALPYVSVRHLSKNPDEEFTFYEGKDAISGRGYTAKFLLPEENARETIRILKKMEQDHRQLKVSWNAHAEALHE